MNIDLKKTTAQIDRCLPDSGEANLIQLHRMYELTHLEYYQVALTVREETSLARELGPLDAIPDHNPKYLLVMDNDPPTSYNGIRQKYALDWLLEK